MKTLIKILGILIIIAGILGGLYIGLWVMFIGGILNIANMIDGNLLTAKDIAIQVIKIILASPVGFIIFYIGTIVGGFITASSDDWM